MRLARSTTAVGCAWSERACSSGACAMGGSSARRVLGARTTLIRTTTWSADQIWGRLLFLLIVINDSKQSSTLRRSGARSRALAGRGPLRRLSWHHPRLGLLPSHRSLVGDSVIGGRHCLTVIFITTGVSITPSSVIHRRVYSCRVLYAGRQGHIHRRSVNISDLRDGGNKLSEEENDNE
jgi:hypothetical protein